MPKVGKSVLPRLSLSVSRKNTQGLFELNYFSTIFIETFSDSFYPAGSSHLIGSF